MKKYLLALLVLPILAFFNPLVSNAFVVESINDYGGVLKAGPYYDSATDQIRIDFYGTDVVQTVHTFNGSTVRVSDATSWWVASGFTCVGSYQFEANDASGNTLLALSITIEEGDLNDPVCDSGNAGEEPSEETSCSSKVCECIAELQAPLADINSSIGETNGKLDSVNGNLSDLKGINTGIKDAVVALHDEFQTDQSYGVDPLPDFDSLLEDNAPDQPTTPFTDNNDYFSDRGDVPESPSKIPSAPEPKDWDGYSPESAMPPEAEQSKDAEYKPDLEMPIQDFELDKPLPLDLFEPEKEMVKDTFTQDEFSQESELQKDTFTKDGQMTTDSYSQDAPIGKSPEMNTQTNQQTPEITIDSMTGTESYGKTHVYQQTNVFP